MTITRKGTPEWRVHPGEILREEFLKPMKLSVYQLAQGIACSCSALERCCAAEAWGECRHCHPASEVFWDLRAILAWIAGGL